MKFNLRIKTKNLMRHFPSTTAMINFVGGRSFRRRKSAIIIIVVAISISCFLFANLKLLLLMGTTSTTTTSLLLLNNDDNSHRYAWHPDLGIFWTAENKNETTAATTATTTATTTTTTKVLVSPFMNRSYNYQSQQQQQQKQQSRRNIFFIHVGKTGGETVKSTFLISCRMRKNYVHRKKCFNSFYYPNGTLRYDESEISKHVVGVMHADLILPTIKSINRATTFLWTIRNPIMRIISWYRYTSPKNCDLIKDNKSTACNTNRLITKNLNRMRQQQQQQDEPNNGSSVSRNGSTTIKPKWATKFFEFCFPTMNDFVSGLTTNNTYNSTTIQLQEPPIILNCSELAWKTIHGLASPTSSHAYFNYKYYWDNTIAKYPSIKEIWVIRTEYLWNDLDYIENILFLSTNDDETSSNSNTNNTNVTTIVAEEDDEQQHRRRRISSSSIQEKQPQQQQQQQKQLLQYRKKNVTHGSEGYIQRDGDDLSKLNRRYLCCALIDEILVYKNLLDKATNLRPSDKEQALSNAVQECDGIDIFSSSSPPSSICL